MSSPDYGSLFLVALTAVILFLALVFRQKFAPWILGVGIALVLLLLVAFHWQLGFVLEAMGRVGFFGAFVAADIFTLAGAIGIAERIARSSVERRFRLAVQIGMGILGLVVVSAPIWTFVAMVGFQGLRGAGRFDRPQMESLVAQVRQDSFTGEKDFSWERDSKGNARLTPSGSGKMATVFAKRDKDQNLIVVIHTEDGWKGGWGFAYSDVPFKIVPDGEDEAPPGGCELDVPGPMQAALPQKKIDAHWWPVVDNLD